MVVVKSVVVGSPIGRILLVAEAQQTETAITALIALLLVIAAMLALLTLWYWRHTNPRRRVQQLLAEEDHTNSVYNLDVDRTYDDDFYDDVRYHDQAGYTHDQGQGYQVSFQNAGQRDYR